MNCLVPAVLGVGLVFVGGGAQAQPLDARSDPEAIADLRVASGDNQIIEAWFIAPTQRYTHFVQGSDYEAAGLRVLTRAGDIVTARLGEESVFEDRLPRLADLDGDGADEIVVVLTSVHAGASLAVYALGGDRLALRARTAFIGTPRRWLNPAGIADFDGDGRLEIAAVLMPHLAKRLALFRLEGGELAMVGSMQDVSNHRNGSVHTEMSALADIDGDGVTDLIVPDGSRAAIRVISFADGADQGTEIARYALPGPADGAFALTGGPGQWRLGVGLEDGGRIDIDLRGGGGVY